MFCVFAFAYDDILLDAQIRVLPKIALLDKDLSKKLIDNKVVLVIARDKDDSDEAKAIAEKILSNTGGILGSYRLKVVVSDFANLSKNDMSLLYIMDSSEANIKKAVQVAREKDVVSFTYSREALSMGATLSLQIERNTVIMLNKNSVKDSSIRFVDSFYKIIRVVE